MIPIYPSRTMAIAGSALLLLYGVALIALNLRRLFADWKRTRVRHSVDAAFIQIYLGLVLIGVAWFVGRGFDLDAFEQAAGTNFTLTPAP